MHITVALPVMLTVAAMQEKAQDALAVARKTGDAAQGTAYELRVDRRMKTLTLITAPHGIDVNERGGEWFVEPHERKVYDLPKDCYVVGGGLI